MPLGGQHVDAADHRLAQHRLQRKRKRLVSARMRQPRIRPLGDQLTRRLAGASGRAHGVPRRRGQHLGHRVRRGLGFLGGQPHRPGPRAGRTDSHHPGHLPTGDDAAGGQHRHRTVDGLENLRDDDERADLAAVPTGLGALRDDQVNARGDLLDGVLLGSDQRRDGDATFLARLDHVVRRYPQRIGDELHRMGQRDVEQLAAGVPRQRRPAEAALRLGFDVVVAQQVVDEIAVGLRDAAGQVGARQLLALALELRRHDQIHPVGLAADRLVDPRQLTVELLGGVRRGAQHAESAGVGDRGHHVAAVAEREEREVDAVLLTQRLRGHGDQYYLTAVNKGREPPNTRPEKPRGCRDQEGPPGSSPLRRPGAHGALMPWVARKRTTAVSICGPSASAGSLCPAPGTVRNSFGSGAAS